MAASGGLRCRTDLAEHVAKHLDLFGGGGAAPRDRLEDAQPAEEVDEDAVHFVLVGHFGDKGHELVAYLLVGEVVGAPVGVGRLIFIAAHDVFGVLPLEVRIEGARLLRVVPVVVRVVESEFREELDAVLVREVQLQLDDVMAVLRQPVDHVHVAVSGHAPVGVRPFVVGQFAVLCRDLHLEGGAVDAVDERVDGVLG